MAIIINAQAVVTAAPGTGTVSLGAGATNSSIQSAQASSVAALSWSTAGAKDGGIYSYRIDGIAGWEVGIGTYSASGPSLARTTVLASSNGGAAVNFGADAVVSQVLLPVDVSSITVPQGRLTLTSGTPVLTSNVSAVSTIYYTPYIGNMCLVGNSLVNTPVPVTFQEVSQALSDTTKSPSAAVAGAVYDLFSWMDGSIFRVTRGPAWSAGATAGSNTVRGSGAGSTALVRVNGVFVNAYTITNGPAAGYGVYQGTIATDSSGATVSWNLGGAATGGVAAILNVWNMFNRIRFKTLMTDNTSSWTYNSTTWRSANNAAPLQRATFVQGILENFVEAEYLSCSTATANTTPEVGVGLNSTNTLAPGTIIGQATETTGSIYTNMLSTYVGLLLGANYLQAIENVLGGTAGFYGGTQGSFRVELSA